MWPKFEINLEEDGGLNDLHGLVQANFYYSKNPMISKKKVTMLKHVFFFLNPTAVQILHCFNFSIYQIKSEKLRNNSTASRNN